MTMRPLAVIGNVNVDLIMGPTTPWPVPGTEVIVKHDELRPGGAAGNAALAWAGLGVPFTIASSVGTDAFGQWLSGAFAPHSDGWTKSSCNTTISVGLTHPGDERTFFTTRGHLADLGWKDIAGQLDHLQGGILLLCGCFLMDGLASEYPALFDWAAKHEIDIALDPGWPVDGWTRDELSRTKGWLKHTHHLLVNEIEALSLSGAKTVDAALPALVGLMPTGATVVIKAGGRGAYGMCRTTKAQASAPLISVIDTIGAGAIFNAGYLLAVGEGQSLPAALIAAVDLASRAISTSPRHYERARHSAGVA
jgi:sugar/nucleoside kinase (ribokinase family)